MFYCGPNELFNGAKLYMKRGTAKIRNIEVMAQIISCFDDFSHQLLTLHYKFIKRSLCCRCSTSQVGNIIVHHYHFSLSFCPFPFFVYIADTIIRPEQDNHATPSRHYGHQKALCWKVTSRNFTSPNIWWVIKISCIRKLSPQPLSTFGKMCIHILKDNI